MLSKHKLLPLIFLVYGVQLARAGCSNATLLSTQLDLLLAQYERGAPPAARAHVGGSLVVRHVSLHERDAVVRLIATMHLSWEDKRLSWNASEWGCESTLVSAERLWLPDVRVLSAATAGPDSGAGPRARLSSAGRVAWPVPVDLVAPVTLALHAWPNDIQQIVFKFGSQSLTADELKLTIDKDEHPAVFESGSWELLSIRGAETTWRRLDSDQSLLTWTVRLRRRAAAHALAAGAVLAAAVLLLVAAALLPPAERPCLCAAAALAVTLWLISSLPRLGSSSSAPLVLRLLSAVGCAAALAAIGAALVPRVARCSAPPPPALRKLLTAASAFCSLGPKEAGGSEHSAWAAAAQLLDYAVIAVLGLTLIVIVCLHL